MVDAPEIVLPISILFNWALLETNELLNHWFLVIMLKSSLQRFYEWKVMDYLCHRWLRIWTIRRIHSTVLPFSFRFLTRVTQLLLLVEYDHCLSFCPLSFAHRIICPLSFADRIICPSSFAHRIICPSSFAHRIICPSCFAHRIICSSNYSSPFWYLQALHTIW
jgi:hypothetical protein